MIRDRIYRPLLQFYRPRGRWSRRPTEGRWAWRTSRTGISVLTNIRTPWLCVNLWRPHHISRWLWIVPDVVRLDRVRRPAPTDPTTEEGDR